MKPTLPRRAGGAWRTLCRFGSASVTALALASIAPSAAFAQDDEELEEVVVTGSRLTTNPNLAAATPVLSVTGDEGMLRGNVRIEDFVNVLPQVFAGQASEVSNGASGTASLNLRGLGAIRTLVLIDGKRLPYGSSVTATANLDVVPLQLVERVDILTGGASAVYGSDAVAGVANFILKRDFEGVEFGGQYGQSYSNNKNSLYEGVLNANGITPPGSHSDGAESLLYAIIGANTADGRGNVTLFASYEDRDEISQADRVESACSMGQSTGATSFQGLTCFGSSNFRRFNGSFQNEDGTLVPGFSGPQTFNFGPYNFFQRPSERWNLYAKGHYDIADNVEAFADFSYTNNFSDAQIAPSASFGRWSVNCDNPYLQGNTGTPMLDALGCTEQDVIDGTISTNNIISHRNVEGGNRNTRLENSAWRVIAGLRGSFADDIWGWEAFVQNSETRDQDFASEDFVVANVQQALFATTDADGNVVCTDPSGGCIPYNPFQRSADGGTLITQEQVDYLIGDKVVNGGTSQFLWGGNLQADLGDYGVAIPWADAGIGVLFGIEYRKDEIIRTPDLIAQTPGGGFTGVGGADTPISGQVEVQEFYTEFEMPIIAGMTGIQELTLRGQYRYSDYEGQGNDTTTTFDANAYGLSLAYAPIDSLRLRAQYQRAVRAPNVIELYSAVNTGLPNLSAAGTNDFGVQLFDPCSSTAPIRSESDCARTGVLPGQYGTIFDVAAGQTQSVTGGNPGLTPETADTVTFGLVWTPEFAESLSISVDYFTILVEDVISAGIPASTTLNQCLDTGDATFCNLITRGIDGQLAGAPGVGFDLRNLNLAELETTGIDFQVNYNWEFGRHSIVFDYAATYLDQLDTVPFPGGDPIVCSGFFGNECGSPNPEYRHRFIGTWVSPWSFDIATTWRYFGETDNDNPGDTTEPTLSAVNYIDVAGNWYITDDISVRLSVLNLLGERPPVFTGAGPALGNGNTYPTVFDTSTTWFTGFRLNF